MNCNKRLPKMLFNRNKEEMYVLFKQVHTRDVRKAIFASKSIPEKCFFFFLCAVLRNYSDYEFKRCVNF